MHFHLDCSLSYQAVAWLVPDLSREDYWKGYVAATRCTNLANIVTRAPKGVSLMQDEAALRLVTEDQFQQPRSISQMQNSETESWTQSLVAAWHVAIRREHVRSDTR